MIYRGLPCEKALTKPAQKLPSVGVKKAAIVDGTVTMVEAKMTGMTPAILTFMGRNVLCPPYCFLPTTLLAYCTGIRRSALVITMPVYQRLRRIPCS